MEEELFVSYSIKDKELAYTLVKAIESDGKFKCFIAPRDIHEGEYPLQIVEAIERAKSVVLIFSKHSNDSVYVLREMNSAVLRHVPIIPYRIDDTELSKSMEFYLGVVQFLDAYKMTKNESFLSLKTWLIEAMGKQSETKRKTINIHYSDYIVLGEYELSKIGYDIPRIVMETIEIDYITLHENDGDYVLNEMIEGNYTDWVKHVKTYPDIYSILIKEDKAVGYYQYELLNEKNYHDVVDGKKMVHPRMMEFYGFGGVFYLYIGMLTVLKEHESMKTVMMLLDRLFKCIEDHIKHGVILSKIAISVYSDFIRVIVEKMGFVRVCNNLAFGDIYELDLVNVKNNMALKNRYPTLYSTLMIEQ